MIKLCQWDITGSCNLNCIYCREKTTSGLHHLPLEKIFRIIDQFHDMQVKMVSISGGEPLTLKSLPRILAYLKNKVETIGLTTNATLVSKANIGYIKEFCGGVQVSLDGSCAKIHDYFRGYGSFGKTIKELMS
jgi:MoaA/NifB/PqqE/SkfB family radical SAM enzyme